MAVSVVSLVNNSLFMPFM